MRHRCPISNCCIAHLIRLAESTGDQPLSEEIELLRAKLDTIPAVNAYIRLRGFMLVELMLESIQKVYDKGYLDQDKYRWHFTLEVRSWGGLTRKLENLDTLLDTVGLDIAELQLSGATFSENDLLLIGGSDRTPEEAVAAAKLATTTQLLRAMAKHAREAIVVLRPYLRNEKRANSTSKIADHFAGLLQRVEGYYSRHFLLTVTKRIMDVNL